VATTTPAMASLDLNSMCPPLPQIELYSVLPPSRQGCPIKSLSCHI